MKDTKVSSVSVQRQNRSNAISRIDIQVPGFGEAEEEELLVPSQATTFVHVHESKLKGLVPGNGIKIKIC